MKMTARMLSEEAKMWAANSKWAANRMTGLPGYWTERYWTDSPYWLRVMEKIRRIQANRRPWRSPHCG